MGFRMAVFNTLYIYETPAYVKNTLFNSAILTLYTLHNYATFEMLLNRSLLLAIQKIGKTLTLLLKAVRRL